VRVRIPAIGVDAVTAPVGVVPTSNLLEAPSDAITLGWYRHGPSPGEPGSALIAGHVDFDGRRGVFFALSRLEPGAAVTVDYEDGSARTWRVVARRQYDKAQLPTDVIFARSGPPALALVTCGGLYDASRRSYRDNVVVFAVPA
jgi:sortase (surface protein transpeptidase)